MEKIRNALSKVGPTPKANTSISAENTGDAMLAKHYKNYAMQVPEMISMCVSEMLKLQQQVSDVNERYEKASKNIMGYDLSRNMSIKRAVLKIMESLAENRR